MTIAEKMAKIAKKRVSAETPNEKRKRNLHDNNGNNNKAMCLQHG